MREFYCSLEGDRFIIRRGDPGHKTIQIVFEGEVMPTGRGSIVIGSFMIKRTQIPILVIWFGMMTLFAVMEPFQWLTGQKKFDETDWFPALLPLGILLVFAGLFVGQFHGTDVKRITAVMEALFGPAEHIE